MNGQELVAVEPAQLATRQSPMDALALMSDQEFEQRLSSLKLAQRRMERIQRELMTPEVDYGVIPGTGSKPTLLKPGAEKLGKFHHLVPTFTYETILGDGVNRPHIRIVATCSLHFEAEDGPIVAQGLGACNSWEKKYRYRESQRRCPVCGAAAIFRSKYPDKQTGELGWYCFAKKGGCGATFGEHDTAITDQQQGQVDNPDPFDGENTYVKMAAKRSQTDATLRATATSGLFSQDLEDMVDSESVPAAPRPAPQPRQQAPKPQPKATAPEPTEPEEPTSTSEDIEEFTARQESARLSEEKRNALIDQIKADAIACLVTAAQLDEFAQKYKCADLQHATDKVLDLIANRLADQRAVKGA